MSSLEQKFSFLFSAYDSFDRVTEANTQTHTLSYGYDSSSERTEETQDGITLHKERTPSAPITTLQFLSHTQSVTRDIPQRQTRIEVEGQTIALDYDTQARTQHTLYPNGLVEEAIFSPTGELATLSTAKATYSYDRDILGRITQITATSAEGNTTKTPYRYDDKGQLIGAGKTTFTYDTAGNPQHNNASYDPKNHRLLEDSLYTYSYDDNGNLTAKQNRQSGESTTYGWNTFGQLIKVRTATQTLRYSYDALGRRVSKQTESVAEPGRRGVTELSRSTHHYLYDGQHIVAILNKDKQLLATITHHPSQVDTPLSITNHSTSQTYYYHRDHQGSIIALSNEAGQIVESFIYDGHYGKILNHYTTEETMNPYGYTGREIDLPDLYYYRARYYDPGMQRFISVDPIEFESGDFNLYRYVGNDPMNQRDPRGLASYPDINATSSSDLIEHMGDLRGVKLPGAIGKIKDAAEVGTKIYKRFKSQEQCTQDSQAVCKGKDMECIVEKMEAYKKCQKMALQNAMGIPGDFVKIIPGVESLIPKDSFKVKQPTFDEYNTTSPIDGNATIAPPIPASPAGSNVVKEVCKDWLSDDSYKLKNKTILQKEKAWVKCLIDNG